MAQKTPFQPSPQALKQQEALAGGWQKKFAAEATTPERLMQMARLRPDPLAIKSCQPVQG